MASLSQTITAYLLEPIKYTEYYSFDCDNSMGTSLSLQIKNFYKSKKLNLIGTIGMSQSW